MALSFFDDKSEPPTEDALHVALGATTPLWQELRARIGRRFSQSTNRGDSPARAPDGDCG